MATNAARDYIPLMIIYKGKRMLPELQKVLPPGTIVCFSESKYVNKDLFFGMVGTLLQICKKAEWQDFISFSSGGYWVRQMRQLPRAPLENSTYSFISLQMFFRNHYEVGKNSGRYKIDST